MWCESNVPYQHPSKVSHKPCQPHRPNLISDSTNSHRAMIAGSLFGHRYFHQNRKFSDSRGQRQHWSDKKKKNNGRQFIKIDLFHRKSILWSFLFNAQFVTFPSILETIEISDKWASQCTAKWENLDQVESNSYLNLRPLESIEMIEILDVALCRRNFPFERQMLNNKPLFTNCMQTWNEKWIDKIFGLF